MFNAFFGRAMDLAIAAVVGFVMAIVGVAVLAVAAAWQLSLWMPWPGALAVTGVGVLAIAAIALWIGTAKKKKPEPEPEEQMSDADPVGMVLGLMELPVEVVKRIVMEKPIASIALISSVGLLIARKPEVALKLLITLIRNKLFLALMLI